MPRFKLHISRSLLDAVIAHARAETPNECCGLLAGMIENGEGRVAWHFPLVNELFSPTEYLSESGSMIAAEKGRRTAGLEVLAIYHSHPASEPIPSKTDLARNYWGETVMHVIVGLAGIQASIRGWWLGETDFQEAEIVVT